RNLPLTSWRHHRHGGNTSELDLEHDEPAHYQHDDVGLLAITIGDHTIYRRRPPRAVTRSTKLVHDELPDRIAAWALRNAPPAEQIYCLSIGYVDFYNAPLPPSLGLGTVAELERWRASNSPDVELRAFSPAAFACHELKPPELDSPQLSDAYQ